MRTLSTIIIALLLAAGGAYFFLKDDGYTLKFTESDLRERVDERMPFSEDYLFIFNVTLENPRIDLIDGSDRIAGGLDAIINVSLGGGVPINGAVDISGGVRYAPDEGAFYMTDPRVENVKLQGVPDNLSNRANQAISLALDEFYRTRPIYVLSDSDMRHVATKMVLRDVQVKNEVLYVTLGIGEEKK